MSQMPSLSRRERQIMDVLYAHDGASVATVQQELPEAPTDMAVRRLLHILEEKGHVKREKAARGFRYLPKHSKKLAATLKPRSITCVNQVKQKRLKKPATSQPMARS